MYEPMIEIIQGNLQTQLEGEIMRVVRSVGVNVDKEELIKALAYDRQQYEKGYADAKEEYQRPHGKWTADHRCTNCGEYALSAWALPPVKDPESACYYHTIYCPWCGATMEG
jgi:hypothetical protein